MPFRMAQKLGFLNQWLFGSWAERAAINRNADSLSRVELTVHELRVAVQQQGEQLVQLRAVVMGVVELLQLRATFHEAELERAVKTAWTKLTTPPPAAVTTHPYRGSGDEPSAADVEAARELMRAAQDHHFSRRFDEARPIYQEIVERFGNTKQAKVARDQLVNLRGA